VSKQIHALSRVYFDDLLSGGDLAAAEHVLAEDLVVHPPTYWGEPIRGRENYKAFIVYLRTAFPDLNFTIGEEAVEDNIVATVFRLRGTQKGEYMGIPAAGKQMDLPGVDVFRLKDGKIQEIRIFYDTLGLMQQLGVSTVPQASPV
jgi:steroid delta-isomerase-like uncharacterized protein